MKGKIEYLTELHAKMADPDEAVISISELKEQGLDDSTIYDLLYNLGVDIEILKKELDL